MAPLAPLRRRLPARQARRVLVAAGLALLLIGRTPAQQVPGQPGGFPPDEAAARMTLPAGFHAEVFAAEPEIRQPVAACFDDRGRMWVIEYLQYPAPAGLKPVAVDQYLRTVYDRIPEPPPKGPRGADRIKILEDTDGDGRADKVTTFFEGLNLASGLAVGHGGVYVAQAPYLLFYPDRDRDDRPDGDPEVLLAGFGLEDAHAVVNSLAWGPDGWLYGAQGSTVTAKIQGIEFQQGIWRFHPRTHAFELFAEGGGNTWGLDFDRQGRIFGSSNGGFLCFHMVQGGYYWKGFAKHGPLHNPRAFGYFDAIAYEGSKQGGHVTPGGIIYKGDNFPDAFRDVFLGGNLLSNAVYWHPLAPLGSTVKGRHGGSLIEAHDPWFRPIDLLTGPDGCVYVVDWYDRRASHLDPRDTWDKSNGRIYRVVYGERPKVAEFDLAALSTTELIALRERKNDWWPEAARRLLWERRDPAGIEPLRDLLVASTDERLAMINLWALDACGGLDTETSLGLLAHPVAPVRAWVVRRLGDEALEVDRWAGTLARLAAREPSPEVRSQIAATAQRLPVQPALELVRALASRGEDSSDRHIPLQLWWAVEKALRVDPEAVVKCLGSDAQRLPIVRSTVLERVARSLSADDRLELLTELLTGSPDSEARSALLKGIELGLEGRRPPAVAPAARQGLLATIREDSARRRIAIRLGDQGSIDRAWAEVASGNAQGHEGELLRLLGRVDDPLLRRAMLERWKDAQPSPVDDAWLDALANDSRPEVADALIARYPDLAAGLRPRVIGLLCTRPTWAGKLLDALEAKAIPPADVKTPDLVQLARLGDSALRARVEAVLGKVPGAGKGARARRIAEVRGILPEGDKGDTRRGHAVFQKACIGCHQLFGEGQAFGPDLTGVERGNLEFLLESLIDPSRTIRKEYQPVTVATTDGRVLSGLVVEESENALVIFDAKQQKTRVAKSEIEEQQASPVSVMPEGLLESLDDTQIRDLIRYLQASGLPPE